MPRLKLFLDKTERPVTNIMHPNYQFRSSYCDAWPLFIAIIISISPLLSGSIQVCVSRKSDAALGICSILQVETEGLHCTDISLKASVIPGWESCSPLARHSHSLSSTVSQALSSTLNVLKFFMRISMRFPNTPDDFRSVLHWAAEANGNYTFTRFNCHQMSFSFGPSKFALY